MLYIFWKLELNQLRLFFTLKVLLKNIVISRFCCGVLFTLCWRRSYVCSHKQGRSPWAAPIGGWVRSTTTPIALSFCSGHQLECHVSDSCCRPRLRRHWAARWNLSPLFHSPFDRRRSGHQKWLYNCYEELRESWSYLRLKHACFLIFTLNNGCPGTTPFAISGTWPRTMIGPASDTSAPQ